MITVLHRGALAKWLQYYIGVGQQMVTVLHRGGLANDSSIPWGGGGGGYAQMITILHRGGGVSLDPQKWLRNMCTTPYQKLSSVSCGHIVDEQLLLSAVQHQHCLSSPIPFSLLVIRTATVTFLFSFVFKPKCESWIRRIGLQVKSFKVSWSQQVEKKPKNALHLGGWSSAKIWVMDKQEDKHL